MLATDTAHAGCARALGTRTNQLAVAWLDTKWRRRDSTATHKQHVLQRPMLDSGVIGGGGPRLGMATLLVLATFVAHAAGERLHSGEQSEARPRLAAGHASVATTLNDCMCVTKHAHAHTHTHTHTYTHTHTNNCTPPRAPLQARD